MYEFIGSLDNSIRFITGLIVIVFVYVTFENV